MGIGRQMATFDDRKLGTSQYTSERVPVYWYIERPYFHDCCKKDLIGFLYRKAVSRTRYVELSA
ncbi:MAG: hypothetical protein AAFQ74_13725 [Cyanobacteria bacterium J06623_4]